MTKLSEEQKQLLIHIGKPDDSSETHIIVDFDRIGQDLMKFGLVHRTGKDRYDLTDEGERLYGELTGEDVN